MHKSVLIAIMTGSLLIRGDELATNRALKAELAQEQKTHDELRRRAQELAEKAAVLQETADRVAGLKQGLPAMTVTYTAVHEFYQDADLLLENDDEKQQHTVWKQWLDLAEGGKYRFRAQVKSDNVKNISNIKFGLMIPVAGAKTQWPAAAVGAGTFPWREVSFTTTMPFGSGGRALLLCGMEGNGTGQVAFRNIVVERISE
ncbi:hypothetical protein [Oligosphaera ethanolica]|uniref:FtsZ-binding cell division protein ZapB n=1 Tax=Oligosphaera ethanolica TaxID=760260 RepID=A0AAE3VEF9_9BACT|nr:hypothetical protein [Oligosphaera ethanolica]MDQ0288916.1 FtsZ-binding cell division protein ZapB [Oligosphaera ethanolica]